MVYNGYIVWFIMGILYGLLVTCVWLLLDVKYFSYIFTHDENKFKNNKWSMYKCSPETDASVNGCFDCLKQGGDNGSCLKIISFNGQPKITTYKMFRIIFI